MLEEEDAEDAKKQLESAAVIDATGKGEEVNQACPPDGIIEMLEEEDAENAKKQLESAAVIDAEDKRRRRIKLAAAREKRAVQGPAQLLHLRRRLRLEPSFTPLLAPRATSR